MLMDNLRTLINNSFKESEWKQQSSYKPTYNSWPHWEKKMLISKLLKPP